jgi:Na+-translocating ferredoxin:NAD+ oxidoreductase subunit G
VPKFKVFLEQSWLLIVSSFFFGLMISGANAAWKDKIDYNLNVYKFNKVAKEVLPEAANFEELSEKVDVETGASKKVTVSLRKAKDADSKDIGWLFICQGKGFADTIQLILAVDSSFTKIKGYGVLASSETPGFGEKIKFPFYKDQFIGAPVEGLVLTKTGDPKKIDSEIVAITGATISSKAVVDILNRFLPQIKKTMQEKGMLKNG